MQVKLRHFLERIIAEKICEIMQLPEVCRLNASGELNVENIDVFCEKGVFGVEQTKRILQEGIRAGMRPNFHGEELAYLGSAEVGLEVDKRTVV